MTESVPPSPPSPPERTSTARTTATEPASAPAAERARRSSVPNMVRSLLPLVLIVLALAGWAAFKDGPDVNPVHPIDPSSTVQLAAARAGYPLLVPTGLSSGYRPTSARTDAGSVRAGDPVTLEIGYVTPSQEYLGFVISDNPRAEALTSVLAGARRDGTVEVDGASWTRSTTRRGETALSRQVGKATVLVTGSAKEAELETVVGSLRPYSG